MNKQIRHISQEIQAGRSLEENIPALFNYMADRYQTFAKIRLAMHYDTFYEAYYDDENTWSAESVKVVTEVNHLIKESILTGQSGFNREQAVKKADVIRRKVTARMNVLSAYMDMFQNYEYVLNRVEYRFKGEAYTVDEEEFSKEILRFIFDSEDNLIINEKIKDMIGQLPLRITRQKYFEILKESLKAYLGARKSSLDTILYMLRTCAMVQQEDEMEALYPSLYEKKEYLAHLNYKDITKEEYEKAIGMLRAATCILETETTVYYGLQEIINEVYALLLCSPYSGMVSSIVEDAGEAADSILRDINEVFLTKEKKDIWDKMTEKLEKLEGIQEELSFELDTLEGSLYDIDKYHKAFVESLMLNHLMQVLLRTQSLLSNSLFIDLEDTIEDKEVDADMIEKEYKALEHELTELFSGYDRMIGRAVMANTINKVPVFFNSHKEVMDYVLYSFEHCSDVFEKAACVEIIKEIMKA